MRPVVHLPQRQPDTSLVWVVMVPIGRGPAGEGKAREALEVLESLGWKGWVRETSVTPQDLS